MNNVQIENIFENFKYAMIYVNKGEYKQLDIIKDYLK